jgi:hypothetical protein
VAGDGVDWRVPMVNPAENLNQVSVLRLVNTSSVPVGVQISGVDDAGRPSGTVTLGLDVLESLELDSVDLERGNAAKGLSGALGDGTGKWRLVVSASDEVKVLSLLRSPGGYLTNLSSVSSDRVLWYVPSASNPVQQGFIRLVNPSSAAMPVRLQGVDAAGQRSAEVTATVAAGAALQVNSQDLELGNAGKGLAGAFGAGSGDWRVEVDAPSALQLGAYLRTRDGFLTAMNDRVRDERVVIFNPGENLNQVSVLRLVNTGSAAAEVVIHGTDDAGVRRGPVRVSVPAQGAVLVTAQELEAGAPARGIVGGLGDGSGKWWLELEAPAGVEAVNLLRTPTGYITNLSSAPEGSLR